MGKSVCLCTAQNNTKMRALCKIWSKTVGLQLAGWTAGISQGALQQRQVFVEEAKCQPCSYNGGLLLPSFLKRRGCLGKRWRYLREKSEQTVRKVSIAAGPTARLSAARKALQGEHLRLSALQGVRWLLGAPPAALEGQVYLVYLWGKDLRWPAKLHGGSMSWPCTWAHGWRAGRCRAQSRPNNALCRSVGCYGASTFIPSPHSRGASSVAAGTGRPSPPTPLYPLFSRPPRPFLTVFHTPALPPFPPVFSKSPFPWVYWASLKV